MEMLQLISLTPDLGGALNPNGLEHLKVFLKGLNTVKFSLNDISVFSATWIPKKM